jgi:hypothetical protein
MVPAIPKVTIDGLPVAGSGVLVGLITTPPFVCGGRVGVAVGIGVLNGVTVTVGVGIKVGVIFTVGVGLGIGVGFVLGVGVADGAGGLVCCPAA